MKYSQDPSRVQRLARGKRALLECGDLAVSSTPKTHLLAGQHPPSLFLTEGFVPEELLKRKRSARRRASTKHPHAARPRLQRYRTPGVGEPVERSAGWPRAWART